MTIPKPKLGRDCSSAFPSASLSTTNPTTIATDIAVRTRYRIWFSGAVAIHGGPRPTQKRATSANGVMKRIPVSASNRGRRHAQWADGSKDDRHNENGKEEPITETPVH